MADRRHTILCVSSYYKGNAFLERAHAEGAHVILLTIESMLQEPWARKAIDEVFALPSFADRSHVIRSVAYLARTRRIDRLVALDDYDVEITALLREHLRVPGMGETTARYFRDKLAMRARARDRGVRVPDFVGLLNHDEVRRFLAEVPAPWLIKPRSEASAVGIKKCHTADEVWQHVEKLGDEQSYNLIERMIPGPLFHVDALVAERKVVFQEVGAYHKPLLEVAHGGGIYATRTMDRDSREWDVLTRLNEELLGHFGLVRGASHSEFILGAHDGQAYFIETSARVGGANIAEMTEAATGVNLWSEWAKIEVEGEGYAYKVPDRRAEYGGVVISLARDETPDNSSFSDPEIVERLDKKHHIGFVLRSKSPKRIQELLERYIERIAREHHASMPVPDKATS